MCRAACLFRGRLDRRRFASAVTVARTHVRHVGGWGRLAAFPFVLRVDSQPMSIARLAAFVGDEPDFDVRWRLVVEFLKEYHQEPAGDRQRLLAGMPELVGAE